jgi:hypothetical protein
MVDSTGFDNTQYNNSFATSTNITFGAKELPDIWFNAQSFNLPALSFNPPNIGGRAGAVLKMPSDTVTYDEVSLSVIVDRELKVYDKIYYYFVSNLNVEETYFKDGRFDLWVEIRDNKGKFQKKFWFFDARILTIDGLDYDLTDTEDTPLVLNLTFTFNYMDFDNTFRKLKLGA